MHRGMTSKIVIWNWAYGKGIQWDSCIACVMLNLEQTSCEICVWSFYDFDGVYVTCVGTGVCFGGASSWDAVTLLGWARKLGCCGLTNSDLSNWMMPLDNDWAHGWSHAHHLEVVAYSFTNVTTCGDSSRYSLWGFLLTSCHNTTVDLFVGACDATQWEWAVDHCGRRNNFCPGHWGLRAHPVVCFALQRKVGAIEVEWAEACGGNGICV